MANAYGEFRGPERHVSLTFRMSVDERVRLREEATKAGLTAQQLFELRMLGAAKPVGQSGRPRKPPEQEEELPIAG